VGSVDGALLPVSERAVDVQQVMRDGDVDFLYLPAVKRDEILTRLPSPVFAATIQAGTFLNQARDLHTFALNSYLMARAGVSEDIIYRISTALFDHNEEFSSYHKDGDQWTAARSITNVAVPFHEGAIRYFRERALWNDELQAQQESFFDGNDTKL
jgi:TRAP transporter TAXI family solute receptor